ncbi:MAG: hypothetical protein AB7S61_03280 [Methanoregulaceae archaeon]
MIRSSRAALVLMLALMLGAAVLMAGCTQAQPLSVQLSDHPTYGKILTDSNGRSLYVIARDVPNTGIIADLGDVSRFYPPFFAESMPGGRGIDTSEFGILTRPDGSKQTTYRGWPLYYYLNDRAAGDAKSQGANNVTFLARTEYTLMVLENASYGIYLTTPDGLTLYAPESANASVRTEGFLPFHASPVIGPSPLVTSSDFSEVEGVNGPPQTAFRGRPLWVFSGDHGPGVIGGGTDGLRPVILAPSGSMSGLGEGPTAAPSPTPTVGTGSPATTGSAPVQATTVVTTRSPDDPYTGGKHTPTPFQTVRVVSQSTATIEPGVTWTPIAPGTTAAPDTSEPTQAQPTSAQPTSAQPTMETSVPTPSPVQTTSAPTVAPVTSPPPEPVTSVPTPEPVTPVPTPEETTIPTTVPLPEPSTPEVPTTIPNPLPPMPIPTLPPMPIESEGDVNGSSSS